MNSIEVSKMFPAGTVIVAYKGKTLGGAKIMPQWEIKPIIDESQYFSLQDGFLAKLRVKNLICLEFEATNLEILDKSYDFDDSSGELTFVPLDPENTVSHYFPLTKLKSKPEIKNKHSVCWKFEILCGDNGVFMQKIKTNSC